MADDKHYVGGEWYRICDRTGFKIRAPRTRKEWTDRIVREQSWEPRQPQDFVQGLPDDQTVSDPRPRQLDQFQGPLGTTMAATASTGALFIFLTSTVRMEINDRLSIMLDNGDNWYTTIADILTDSMIQISSPLPYSVSSGNVVIDTSALSSPVIVPTAARGI